MLVALFNAMAVHFQTQEDFVFLSSLDLFRWLMPFIFQPDRVTFGKEKEAEQTMIPSKAKGKEKEAVAEQVDDQPSEPTLEVETWLCDDDEELARRLQEEIEQNDSEDALNSMFTDDELFGSEIPLPKHSGPNFGTEGHEETEHQGQTGSEVIYTRMMIVVYCPS